MIAAIARALGNCTVVSADSDLPAVRGLAVENWPIPENGQQANGYVVVPEVLRPWVGKERIGPR